MANRLPGTCVIGELTIDAGFVGPTIDVADVATSSRQAACTVQCSMNQYVLAHESKDHVILGGFEQHQKLKRR